ncbi:MAG: hypothetical protein GY926_19180, partial [bacterium]|nr:hypothetical protein [bacterium]
LAETLTDLGSQNFVKFSKPSSADSDPRANDFFLSLQIPVKTGDGLTYRAPEAVPFSGDDINVTDPSNPGFINTIEVANGGQLFTLLEDLQSIPVQPGDQHGLLGTWYRDTSVSVNSLEVAAGILNEFDPEYAFVSTTIDYPNGSTQSITDHTPLADYLGDDGPSLVGNVGAGSDMQWDTVFVFEGYLYVPVAGTYDFGVGSDDGFELIIDNKVVSYYDGTRSFPKTPTPGSHTFDEAGLYSISLLYYNDGGSMGIELKSNLTGQMEIIPNSHLFLPQGLIYEVVSTTTDAEAVAPLVEGSNYAFFPNVDTLTADTYGLWVPVSGGPLVPSANASGTLHQLRIPGNDPIPGLTDGAIYYLIADETRPGVVQLAASREDACDGLAIDLNPTPSIQLSLPGAQSEGNIDGITIRDSGTGTVTVSAAGNFNGDLLRDLLVAGPSGNYVVFGTADASVTQIDLSSLDSSTGAMLNVAGNVLASA